MGDAAPKAKPTPRAGKAPWMPKLRKRGEKFLSSKYIVILVIILTVTDCALVIAELILDLYSVKQTLIATETQTLKFVGEVKSKYSEDLGQSETVASIFDQIAHSTILWNGSVAFHTYNEAKSNHQDLLESTVSTIPQLQVGSVESSTFSGSIEDSTMVSYSSGNHTKEFRAGADKNVYSQTVIVQDLKSSNSSNASTSQNTSQKTSKHRHRRRSRRGFASRDRPRWRSRSRHVYSPSTVLVEKILRLLPEHKRSVHKTILDQMLVSTARGFRSCVSQVMRYVQQYTMPLLKDLVHSHSEKCSSSRQLFPTVDTKTACSNVHLIQNLTLFQKHLSHLLSMQLNDIMIAYIPVQHKLPLRNFLQRQAIHKNATVLYQFNTLHTVHSSQTHGHSYNHQSEKPLKQFNRQKHAQNTDTKDKMVVDLMYERILSYRNPSISKHTLQNPAKPHHAIHIVKANVELPTGFSTISNSGDTTYNSGDTISNSGDTISNNGDTISNNGDTISHSGDTISNNGDTISNSGDTISNSGDTISNSGDTISNSGDTISNSGDTISNSGDILKLVPNQVKSSRSKRHARGASTERGNGKDVEEKILRREMHHSRELEIAHKLHYASVFVVSVLLIMVIMKVICKGSNFLKRKIEVFDAVVVVTSVVVDLIFIKGLSEFAVDETIFVLALLLPWRVIRVVNSLVMAVIDHEHVKLRLLYSRKKKLDKTVETLRNETDELKGMLQDVRQFCIKEGIDSSRIDGILGKFAPRRRKDSKFYTLVKLVMSTASINNNDNDSISSSSMENDLRDYANRQSVLNENASNEGTVSSLRQYLSVPFFSSNIPGAGGGSSAVSSDQESVRCVGSLDGGEGDPRRSRADSSLSRPSIFITAPPSDEQMAPLKSKTLDNLDTELGVRRQSLCGSDYEGSIGTDGDLEDGEFSDVFEEDEELGERTLFLNEEDKEHEQNTDSDSETAVGKKEVAFYLGSRASLDKLTFFQNEVSSIEPTNCDGSLSMALPGDFASSSNSRTEDSDVIIVPNTNLQPQIFGRFLTVPMCTVPASAVTTVALLTNTTANNNNNNEITTCVGVDITSNTPKATHEIINESKDFTKAEETDNISNLATAVLSPELEASRSSSSLREVTTRSVEGLPRQLSTSEERRKRFASSSPPRIVSSLDIEAARSMAKHWMERSLSENKPPKSPTKSLHNESSPLMMKDLSHKGYSLCPPFGSPVPRKRLPEVRTRRKNYAAISCRSDSSDSDIPKPLLQYSTSSASPEPASQECSSNVKIASNNDNISSSSNMQHPPRKHHRRRHHSGSIGRKRHSEGEGFAGFSQVGSLKLPPTRQLSDSTPGGGRTRSESPGVCSMSLLKVPGLDSRRRSVDSNTREATDNQEMKLVSSSRSMNDVTSDGNGNPFANNVGRDGKILRSSCLSLNSARHKRRGKSPHRVSFKVS